jgi:ribosomal protein L25 (general stress protein Ctc)
VDRREKRRPRAAGKTSAFVYEERKAKYSATASPNYIKVLVMN